jgi:hypothetical protein
MQVVHRRVTLDYRAGKEGKKTMPQVRERYDQRLNTKAPLVPPKPKEFDRA